MIVPASSALTPLVGLSLSRIGHAADMLTIGFMAAGEIASTGVDEWHLHIQCPWRLESGDGLITGSSDWWEHEDESISVGDWNPTAGGSLQMLKLRQALDDMSPVPGGATKNRTALLMVTHVDIGDLGDVAIHMTGDFRLRVFPAGSRGEYWRAFSSDDSAPHTVCMGDPDVTTGY